jgi:putative chitobiose transport system substrate-binding protein
LKAKHKDEALKFALFLTNEQNQLELAKLTNVLATNEKALKNEFYTKYNNGNLKEKARVISASQLDKVTPVYKSSRKQKELNNIINTAVQKILLNKDSTPQILKEVKKDWLLLEK